MRSRIQVTFALGLTVVMFAFTLLPGGTRIVANTSHFLGGSDLTDAVGHLGIFCALTLTWYYALRAYLIPSRALWLSVAIVLLLSTLAELGQQFVPERGANLLDLMANYLGMAVAVGILHFRAH